MRLNKLYVLISKVKLKINSLSYSRMFDQKYFFTLPVTNTLLTNINALYSL